MWAARSNNKRSGTEFIYRPVSSVSETSSGLNYNWRYRDETYFILNLCSAKYSPAIGCEQQNIHKKYVQDMTTILRSKMCNVSGAHGFNVKKRINGYSSNRRSFSQPTFSLSVGLKSRINKVSLILQCKYDCLVAKILKWSHLILWPVWVIWSAMAVTRQHIEMFRFPVM